MEDESKIPNGVYKVEWKSTMSILHKTYCVTGGQINKTVDMELNTFMSAGQYVVLLYSCNGEDIWSNMPINYCYKLSEDSNNFSFRIEKDKSGRSNGWYLNQSSIDDPSNNINKKLDMRLATPNEIRMYQKYDKAFNISEIENFEDDDLSYLIDLFKQLKIK